MGNDPPRRITGHGTRDRAVVNREPETAGLDEGARPRPEGPNLTLQVHGRVNRIKSAVGTPQGAGHGRERLVLGKALERPGEQHRDDFLKELGADGGRFGLEPGCILGSRELPRASRNRRARIEAGVHLHDGHAGLEIAGQDRRGDRRGPTMARQQGRMDVDDAMGREIDDRLRDQLSEVGEHAQIRSKVSDRIDRVGRPDARHLKEPECHAAGHDRHGDRRQCPGPAGTTIRRRDHPDDLDLGAAEQRIEDGHRERTRPEEDGPQALCRGTLATRHHASAGVRTSRDAPSPASSPSSSSSWPVGRSSSRDAR